MPDTGRQQLSLGSVPSRHLGSQLRKEEDSGAESVSNIYYENYVECELTFNTFLMLLIVDVSNDLTF